MAEFFENPWMKYLEDLPRAPFYAMAEPFTLTTGGRSQAESVFNEALNEYYGAVGQQILSGQTPSMTFTSFLQGTDTGNEFPFAQRFAERRRQFGDTTRFVPRTRSIFY